MAEHLLGGQHLTLSYPTKTVLDDVTVGVSAGERIGVVGRNGQGKTSLLSLLLGRTDPHGGTVTNRRGLTVGMLTQTDSLDPNSTVIDAITGGVPEHEWAGNPKIRDILAGLLTTVEHDAKIGQLSGGQRRRVALAQLLTGDWDVLGLDEPTNHLDLEGVAWLADHLKTRWAKNQGALLLVTHDRWFLDSVTEATWEVHDREVEFFEGGYAAYVLARVERDRLAAKAQSKRRNLLRKELAWLRRGAPARTSKPKFRLDAAAELISSEPEPRNSLQLSQAAVARTGKRVVDLENVSAGYGDTTVLDSVTWRIAPGSRVGILGANGSGKSTLLKVVSGELKPQSGTVRRGKTIKVGVVDQTFSQLKEIGDDRVRDVLARTKTTFVVDGKDVTPAKLLERLGFESQYLNARVFELSGGQKKRLQILLALLEEPNLLILDEPTNDLDTDMLTALEDLLDSWPGTLLVVSHDRYLLERVTDSQYAVVDGSLRHLPGGVDEYLSLRRAAASQAETVGSPAGAEDTSQGKASSGKTRHTASKQLASLERQIAKLGEKEAATHRELAALDQSDFTSLAGLGAELKALEQQKAALEEQWLETSLLLD